MPPRIERRSFPRPPLWLNLTLLIVAAATFAYARHQRNDIDRRTSMLFRRSANNPADLNRFRDELAGMDLTKAQLSKELDTRLAYLQSTQSPQFYISIDTRKRKFYFRFGDDVVREADAVIGSGETIHGAHGQTWTFVPLRGAFTVSGKSDAYTWNVPPWWYAMNHQPLPAAEPSIPNGLGHYVIFLPDNYIIHSPPPDASPLKGAKPGSIMVPEADLSAIWPRISTSTRVYIF